MAAGSEKNIPDLQLSGGIDSGDQRLQAYRPELKDQIMDSQRANPLPKLGHRQCINLVHESNPWKRSIAL